MTVDVSHIKDEAVRQALYELETVGGVLSARAFDIQADGTDQRSKLVTAFAAAAGKTLYFPPGTYVIDLSANNTFSLPAGITILGDTAAGTIFEVQNATGTRTLFNAFASNIVLQNLTITMTGTAAAASVVIFNPGAAASGLTLRNLTVNGGVTAGVGSTSHVTIVVQPVGTAGNEFSNLVIDGGLYTNISRAYSHVNSPTVTAAIRGIKVQNARFETFYRSAITINSPNSETSDILISGNRFVDGLYKTTGGPAEAHVSIGSGRQVRVVNNYFGGQGDGIHSEEAAVDQIISSNTLTLTDVSANGIFLADAALGGGGSIAPKNIVISSNTMRGPGLATATSDGIKLVSDASGLGPTNGVVITGNVIEGFRRGISATAENESQIITANTLRDNLHGLWSVKPLMQAKNNLFIGNTVDLYSQLAGMWGEQSFVAAITATVDSGRIGIVGWDIVLPLFTLPATATTNIDITPMPGGMINGSMIVAFGQATNTALGRIDLDYPNGGTLTILGGRIYNLVSVELEGIVINSNIIQARLTNNAASMTNSRLQAQFRGVMFLN
jgi:hypothetical protein